MFADFQIDPWQLEEAIDMLKRVLGVYGSKTGERNLRSTFVPRNCSPPLSAKGISSPSRLEMSSHPSRMRRFD